MTCGRAPGRPGEVLVRGHHVMRGYFEDPEETARAIDADGWLRTGDVGVLDDAGNLRITDRIKDMFIVGGFNAYPAEIEQLLGLHPDIADVAVVGVPDARLGEVGKAYAVRRAGSTLDGGRSDRLVAAGDGQLQGAAAGGVRRRSCRATRAARSSRRNCELSRPDARRHSVHRPLGAPGSGGRSR